MVQNISNKQDAWLTFLSATEPEKILSLVNAYPEFLPCYHDIIAFRRNPKEMIGMFSEALYKMDCATERYMVDELKQELDEKNNTIAEQNTTINELKAAITELKAALAAKKV